MAEVVNARAEADDGMRHIMCRGSPNMTDVVQRRMQRAERAGRQMVRMPVVAASGAVHSHVQSGRLLSEVRCGGIERGKGDRRVVRLGVGSNRAVIRFRRAVECVCDGLESRKRTEWLQTLREVEQELPQRAIEGGRVRTSSRDK